MINKHGNISYKTPLSKDRFKMGAMDLFDDQEYMLNMSAALMVGEGRKFDKVFSVRLKDAMKDAMDRLAELINGR